MVGCVDLDSGGYGESTLARPRPVYGPDSSPTTYYNGGGFGQPAERRASDGIAYGDGTQSYQSGAELGRRDRQDRLSPNHHRHDTKYDESTEREFTRGYNDGYNGH